MEAVVALRAAAGAGAAEGPARLHAPRRYKSLDAGMNGRPSLGRTFSESNQFAHDMDGGLPSWDGRRARTAPKNVKRADRKVGPITSAHSTPAPALVHMLLPRLRLSIRRCYAGFDFRCTDHAVSPQLLHRSRFPLRTLCAPDAGRGL